MIAQQYRHKARRGPDRRGLTHGREPPAAATGARRGIAALVGIAILVGLGVWQLERLQWKEALIARVEAGSTAPPVAAPGPDAWPALDLGDARIPAGHGHAAVSSTTRRSTSSTALTEPKGPLGGVGYLVMTPFQTDDGWIVYVNRGFVPRERKDPATRQGGPDRGRDRRWPACCVAATAAPGSCPATTSPAMSGSRATRSSTPPRPACRPTRVAPYIIDARFDPTLPGGLPQGGETIVDFPNNHLGYALTWFGLAAALAGVFGSRVASGGRELQPAGEAAVG